MKTAAEIRQAFLDFFKSKQHVIVPSAPIVVKNDPTLLFTNAGMNQFKDYFLGNKTAPSPRIADTQKCLRVSGKHNDLEEVGVDTYHHTMFEMLGNWSFGDTGNTGTGYFKKEAIAWSWELLTEVYKLDKDRLYVTIFEGDEKEGLPKDDEAYNEWKKVIAEDRILLGNKKDNFWEMGDTGPCGPCTEIHVDCRSDEERKNTDGKSLVNNDHPQVIEIWNNVFIQFNRKKDGSLEPLPAKHVDTGMGFERLVRVLQNKSSNYDTDVFSGTIEAIEKLVTLSYSGENDKKAIAFRVLADHIRAISFTIADGQLPSNTGAGYVIRRILRRAVRYYYSYLEYKQPLLHQLMPVIAQQFKAVFPELYQQQEFVAKVIKEEEDAFLKTLDKGLKRMDTIMAANHNGIINGEDAFELLDTFGFPIDLTRLIAAENKLTVDEAGFEAQMQLQKNRSRAATVLDTGDWNILNDSNSKGFIGYDALAATTQVLRYRKVKGKGKELYQLVLEQTPFYAESGGQVGDTGMLQFSSGTITVVDTKKENDLIIHFAENIPADLSGEVKAMVNASNRQLITVHHSATHLMHAALRNILGTHVAQKGSLVNDEHLRFDFSHSDALKSIEIESIEKLVNQAIRDNYIAEKKEMAPEKAIASGAMALFGEKYGESVRTLKLGDFSYEVCGGTHVNATGEIGLFKIVSETGIAQGVRRIEALTGEAAFEFVLKQQKILEKTAQMLKAPIENMTGKLEQLLEQQKENQKTIEKYQQQYLLQIVQQIITKEIIVQNSVNIISKNIENTSPKLLRETMDLLKSQLKSAVILLGSVVENKAHIILGVTKDLTEKYPAEQLIKPLAELINGKGGGRADLAQAGGDKTEKLSEALKMISRLV